VPAEAGGGSQPVSHRFDTIAPDPKSGIPLQAIQHLVPPATIDIRNVRAMHPVSESTVGEFLKSCSRVSFADAFWIPHSPSIHQLDVQACLAGFMDNVAEKLGFFVRIE